MLNFDEELKNFKPVKDVAQTEDVIMKESITDMTDVMIQLLKENRDKK